MESNKSQSPDTLLAWLIIATALACVSIFSFDPAHVYFTNDGASTAAVAGELLQGNLPLAGPPAARGGRHFGPWYFYWQALCLAASGTGINGAVFLETLLKAFLLSIGSLLLLRTLLPGRSLVPAAIGAAVCFVAGSWWWVLRTPWHSNYVACVTWPLLFLLCLSAGGRRIPLALRAFVGSLLIQTHLATIPLVAASLGLFTILGFLVSRSTGRPKGSRRLLSLLLWSLTALSWVPTAVYIFVHKGTVFGQAVNTGPGAGRIGLVRSLTLTGQVFRRYIINDHSWETLMAPFPALLGPIYVFLVCVLVLAAALSYINDIGLRYVALTLLVLTYVAAIAFLHPPAHLHYEHSLIILAPVLLGVAVSQAAIWLAAAGSRNGWGFGRRVIFGSSALGVLFLFGVTGYRGASLTLRALEAPPFPAHQSLAHAQEFAALVRDRMTPAPGPLFIINEKERLRESAIALFLGREFYPKMQYAKYFTELAAFKKIDSAAEPRLLLIGCEKRERKTVQRFLEGYALKEEISLSGCRTCGECELSEWKREGMISPARVELPEDAESSP